MYHDWCIIDKKKFYKGFGYENRAVAFTLILAMLFSICGSNDADAKKKKVALNKKKITLTEGIGMRILYIKRILKQNVKKK